VTLILEPSLSGLEVIHAQVRSLPGLEVIHAQLPSLPSLVAIYSQLRSLISLVAIHGLDAHAIINVRKSMLPSKSVRKSGRCNHSPAPCLNSLSKPRRIPVFTRLCGSRNATRMRLTHMRLTSQCITHAGHTMHHTCGSHTCSSHHNASHMRLTHMHQANTCHHILVLSCLSCWCACARVLVCVSMLNVDMLDLASSACSPREWLVPLHVDCDAGGSAR